MSFEDLQKQYDEMDDEPCEDDKCEDCGQKKCVCAQLEEVGW